MNDKNLQDELLSRCESGSEKGRDIPAAELCPDNPVQAEALARRICAIKKAGCLVQGEGPARPRAAEPSLQGTRSGPPGYEILAEIGRGGMGVVYQALQTGLRRTVALKMILSGGHAGEGDLV